MIDVVFMYINKSITKTKNHTMDQYRSVLSGSIKSADKWFEGRGPPQPDSDLSFPGRSRGTFAPSSYDANCFCELKSEDVHIEHPMYYQHRNGKDHRLTTKDNVQTVHPQDPRRTDFILPTNYSRTTNKLQHYYRGVSCRVENLNGKRKVSSDPVMPSNVLSASVANAYNEDTPLPIVNVDVYANRNMTPDVLSNYPQIVQFTLDTMKSNPAGVPDSGVGVPGINLAQTANQSYQQSVSRFMPPA